MPDNVKQWNPPLLSPRAKQFTPGHYPQHPDHNKFRKNCFLNGPDWKSNSDLHILRPQSKPLGHRGFHKEILCIVVLAQWCFVSNNKFRFLELVTILLHIKRMILINIVLNKYIVQLLCLEIFMFSTLK